MSKCPADESAGLVLEPSYNVKENRPECFEKSFPIDQSSPTPKILESSWEVRVGIRSNRELLSLLGFGSS